ncbi:MAG TPA: hypothetical protein VET46_00705 [Steroidobacteraceae bacterium]|nr:hypothetical protein [Steroidobacteraceae bacterium]
MKAALMCALLASVSLGLGGCNKAKSPDDVQADVAKATSEAARNDAEANAKRRQAEAQARQDLARDQAEIEARAADKSVAAVGAEAVTEAEGATRIALARCEALEGAAQKQCREKANAHLQAVKERVKATKDQTRLAQSQ